MIVEQLKEVILCEECGGRCVPSQAEKYVCTTCGLEQETVTDNYLNTAPQRSAERGNNGFIHTHAKADKTGTIFYLGRDVSPKNSYLFYRLKQIQKKSLLYENEESVRKQEKMDESLELIEVTFRRMNFPSSIKKNLFGLFGQIMKEIKFPASKSHLYLSALAWWYVDKNLITDMTIFSICRQLDETGMVKNKPKIKRGISRLVYSKLNNLCIAQNKVKIDTIKKTISRLLNFICDKADEVMENNNIRRERIAELQKERDDFQERLKEIDEEMKMGEFDKDAMDKLIVERDFFNDKLDALQDVEFNIKGVRIDEMLNEVLFNIEDGDERLKKVSGLSHLYEIFHIDDKDEIIEILVHAMDKVNEKYGKVDKRLKRMLSKYRKQIEEVFDDDGCDNTIEEHLQEKIKILADRNVLTDEQMTILEETTLMMLDNINPADLAGRSRHGVAVTLIWLSLMYHGVKISYPDMSEMLNVSESTLGNVGNRIGGLLGFSRESENEEYGYLKPTEKNSVLYELGKSYIFSETYESTLKKVLNELIQIASSSTIPEYCASRILIIKILMKGKKLHWKQCKAEVNKYLTHCINSRKRHIREYCCVFHSDIILPLSHLKKGGLTILEICDEVKKEKANSPYEDFVLFIPTTIRRYIKEVFVPFDIFVNQCIVGNWEETKCKSALNFLLNRLDLTLSDWKNIKLPYFFH